MLFNITSIVCFQTRNMVTRLLMIHSIFNMKPVVRPMTWKKNASSIVTRIKKEIVMPTALVPDTLGLIVSHLIQDPMGLAETGYP